MRWFVLVVVALVVVLGGWVGLGEWRATAIDKVPYRVEISDDAFEVRLYRALVLAEVEAAGTRAVAFDDGIEELFGFIGGDNSADDRIDMTSPALQAPANTDVDVATLPEGEDAWRVRLVMPHWFTAGTLPQPNSNDVKIISRPAETVAVVRFSGALDDRALSEHTAALREWITGRGFTVSGLPNYAIYDRPWRLPFMRRNEVIIPIAPTG